MRPNDPAALPAVECPADALCQAALEELPLSGLTFQQADLSGAALPSLSVRGCAFVGCRFAAADLAKLDARDCLFLSCDFSGAQAMDAYFGGCCLEECKAVGLDARHTLWRDTLLVRSRFAYANFDSAAMEGVRIKDSALCHAFFTQARFRRLRLEGADFAGVNFAGTALSGVDFTDCRLEGLAISQGAPELAGAVVSPQQAVGLCALFGLVVKG